MFDSDYAANWKHRKNLQVGGGTTTQPPLFNKMELAQVTGFSAEQGTYQVVVLGDPSEPYRRSSRSVLEVTIKTDTALTTAPLPYGTTVLLNRKTTPPSIDGVLNLDAVHLPPSAGVGVSILPQPNASPASEKGYTQYTRSPYAPIDVLPGDWITVGPDGNRVAVLLGGYCVLGSGDSAKARFETHQNADLARVVAENYEAYTGFGVLKVHNKEGRCGLSFRAATDQQNESGGSEENWTFKLDIGDSGQFFTMEVCDPDGSTKAKLNITSSGEVTVLSTNGLSLVDASSGRSTFEFASTLITKVLQEMRETVTGNVVQNYGSDRTTRVSGVESRTVNEDNESVLGNQLSSISGSVQKTVYGGSFAEARPTNIAYDLQAHNGSIVLEAGDPKAGANPAAMAGINLVVHGGDVNIGSGHPSLGSIQAPPSTKVHVNSNSIPNSVGLGDLIEKCPSHAVKYEQFETFANTMMAMFDAHIHPPPGTSPPTILMNLSQLPVLLRLAKCYTVKLAL
jgi:hypothetical protein